MDITEILESVKDTVRKNIEMNEVFEQKAIVLRDKCVDNWNKIIKEHLEMLHTLASELCYKYEVFFNVKDKESETEHFIAEYYASNCGRFYVEVRVGQYSFRAYYYSNGNTYSDSADINIYRSKESLFAFADILSTEDKASNLLAEIDEVYCNLFTKVLQKVKEDNEELSKQLETLTSCLSNSSVMEEKEDGSIEIHLNGKTYIGTVKEE